MIEFRDNQKIMFIGDSITDCCRREAPYEPLGCGYVNFAANFLAAKHPHLELSFINRGLNADTTRTMKGRWRRDCISQKPDVLSILIGINDIWHWCVETTSGRAVSPDEYLRNYQQMLTEAKEAINPLLILAEPVFFCDDGSHPVNKALPAYIEIVHALAEKFDAVLVPLQQQYEKLKSVVPPEKWAADMVHPYPWAHAWIADNWLHFVLG